MQVKPWSEKDQAETTVNNALISVLVLERVGGQLPMRTTLSDEDKDQIYGLYRELAYLNIAHRDIRYYNLVCAPPTPSSSSAPFPFLHKKSPFTKKTYKYRLVDFDRSRRINLTFEEQAINDFCWIENIILGAEAGQILDPTSSQLAMMSWSKD
ncbi:hypothetical protein JB92DRAFT_3104155 [Gautieria morchelliformis]|nr:hypothetical protein JB92DRAFT_3104155 [Gautieria morchelliformis]